MSRPRHTTPLALIVPAATAITVLLIPVIGLLQRAPWSTLVQRLDSEVVIEALNVSLIVSLSAAGACFVLGVPLAWILARSEARIIS